MYFIILLKFLIGSASIQELNLKNFEQFIDQHPYVIINFSKGFDCQKCNQADEVLSKISLNFKERQLGFGKINCTKFPIFIKRFSINKYPALLFFRQGDIQVYEGKISFTILFEWLKENLRPLVHTIEDPQTLQEFLLEKVALVYFASQNEFIDPFILMKMKEVNMKYSLFNMVLAKSPNIRQYFGIGDETKLMIFPLKGEPKKYKGYIQDMEHYLIQETLPLIYTGNDLEIQVIMKNQMPFLIIFDEMNHDYFEIAERNQYFIKLFIFDKNDSEAIQIFSELIQQKIDINFVYFHETKNKKTQVISQKDIQFVIWDYIDREDGVRFDI